MRSCLLLAEQKYFLAMALELLIWSPSWLWKEVLRLTTTSITERVSSSAIEAKLAIVM